MSRTVVYLGVGLVVVVGSLVGVYYALLPADTGNEQQNQDQSKATLREALEPLRKRGDISTCQAVLQDVNQYLLRQKDKKVVIPKMAEAERNKLKQEASLSENEMNELLNARFTVLDGHYLDLCWLLRDALRSLNLLLAPLDKEDKPLPVLQRAEIAFDWVVRSIPLPKQTKTELGTELHKETKMLPFQQLYLAPETYLRLMQLPQPEDTVLPKFPELVIVLRHQAPMMRSVLFLLMLQQLGIDGGLLALNDEDQIKYWACGVIGDDKEIYLFDPRLGMPIPGVDGKGVATLRQVRENKDVFAALNLGNETKYDVTLEQARGSEIHLVTPISAWTSRIRFLEESLQKQTLRAQLHVDGSALAQRFRDALSHTQTKESAVRLAPWTFRLQWGYYPESEGGGVPETVQRPDGASEKPLQFQLYTATPTLPAPLKPFLAALPQKFAFNELGEPRWYRRPNDIVLTEHTKLFTKLMLEPGYPRDLLLRGDLDKANQDLGRRRSTLNQFQRQYRQLDKKTRDDALIQWSRKITELFARNASQTELIRVWSQFSRTLDTFVHGVGANELQAQVQYLIAMVFHEEAERSLLRFRSAENDQRQRWLDQTLNDWQRAAKWWEKLNLEHGGNPVSTSGRWHQAEAQERLRELYTQKQETAKARNAELTAKDLWNQLNREHQGLARLSCQYRLRQLK